MRNAFFSISFVLKVPNVACDMTMCVQKSDRYLHLPHCCVAGGTSEWKHTGE